MPPGKPEQTCSWIHIAPRATTGYNDHADNLTQHAHMAQRVTRAKQWNKAQDWQSNSRCRASCRCRACRWGWRRRMVAGDRSCEGERTAWHFDTLKTSWLFQKIFSAPDTIYQGLRILSRTEWDEHAHNRGLSAGGARAGAGVAATGRARTGARVAAGRARARARAAAVTAAITDEVKTGRAQGQPVVHESAVIATSAAATGKVTTDLTAAGAATIAAAATVRAAGRRGRLRGTRSGKVDLNSTSVHFTAAQE
jgi:hypothetical protein